MDWKQKLTSRKLWVAVASFVTLLLLAFGGSQEEAARITAIIMAGASMIAYIIGEGLVDAQGVPYQAELRYGAEQRAKNIQQPSQAAPGKEEAPADNAAAPADAGNAIPPADEAAPF